MALQPQAETTKQATDTAQNSAVKVDYATDLFNMLSLDGPSEDGAEASHADDNNWAGFQCMLHVLLFSLFNTYLSKCCCLYCFGRCFFHYVVFDLGCPFVAIIVQLLVKHQKLRRLVRQSQLRVHPRPLLVLRICLRIHLQ